MYMQDIFELINADPTSIDRLNSEEFLSVATWIVSCRGYETMEWQPTSDGKVFRTIGFNESMELASVIECDTSHDPISPTRIRELRQFASQHNPPVHTITLVSRLVLPPSEIMSIALQSPVELIGRSTILKWVKAAFEEHGVRPLIDQYVHTLMTVGTIGLERQEFGRILLPSDFGAQTFSELATRLGVPQNYNSRLLAVEYFPFDVLRRISQDPRAMHALSPRGFEEFIAELVGKLGFENVTLTNYSGDGGRDIIATKHIHGIPIAFFFECKKYAPDNSIQIATLRSLLGVVAHHSTTANIGVLVTSSRFTRGSIQLIASEARLDGKDYDGIVQWISALKDL